MPRNGRRRAMVSGMVEAMADNAHGFDAKEKIAIAWSYKNV